MKILKSISILKNLIPLKDRFLTGGLVILLLFLPGYASGRIFLDINAPSIQRIKIAIPDFKDSSIEKEQPELGTLMPAVIADDLDLSGYFMAIEKEAFLAKGPYGSPEEIRLRDWSVIGTDLLLVAQYTCIGKALEVEARLYDVFKGHLIMGKRFLGTTADYRTLMHRLSNEIMYALTGQKGMFLSKLAFVGTATGQKEIYLCDIDGQNVSRITSDKSIALFPRWSPQGDSIIYNSFKEGEAMLYLKDLKSGKVEKLSGRKGLNIGASWAPDGRSAALTLSHGENPDVYRIDLTGKILNRLTNHFSIDVSPSFSPDGKRMAFVSNRSGSPQIYVRDLKTEKEERITFTGGNYNTSPVWSSINRIAFTGMDNGTFNIYTVNPDGSNLRRLTEDQGKNEDPCWSMDGRYLVFSSNRIGGYHLYIMNANGQNQTRVTNFKGEQTSPSWSPF